MGWFLPEQDALRRNNGVVKIRTHDEPAELGRASIKKSSGDGQYTKLNTVSRLGEPLVQANP